MSIQSVSDIFEFACKDAEWWDLLHPGAHVPEEVLGELDREAFEAARAHVLDSAADLITACLAAFATRAPKEDARFDLLRKKGFTSKSARVALKEKRKGWVYLQPNQGRNVLIVALEVDWDEKSIQLFASLEGGTAEIDRLEAKHPADDVEVVREGDSLFVGHAPIVAGERFQDIASQLVESSWPGVRKFMNIVAPTKPKKGKQ